MPASSLRERSMVMVSKRSPNRFQAIRGYPPSRAGIMGRDAGGISFRSRIGALAMRSSGYLQLSGVVLLWSVNIILVKAVLPDIPPFALTSLRFAGAVGLFAVIAGVLRIPIVPIPGERIRLAAIGMVQIGLVTALTAVGLSYLSAGRATIVIYTMQIWALPLGYWIADDRLTRERVVGVAVASVGLAMFLSPWLVDWTERQTVMGYLILIGTGFLWALGSCLHRSRQWATSSLTQILWQLAFSSCLIACISILFERDASFRWSPMVWTVLIFSWSAGSVLAYWWWTYALTRMPASQAGQFATLVPLLVFFLSVALFGEQLSIGVVVSSALILIGIAITACSGVTTKTLRSSVARSPLSLTIRRR
jgi:drug/metabolite transporter (DMT)-like permease